MRARAVALLLVAGCGAEPGLVDVAADGGVVFVHDAGFRETYHYPETVCSGVAVVDLEGDGDLDLYAVQAGPVPGTETEARLGREGARNALFRNDGGGAFTDVSASAGAAAHDGYGMGVCAGDVDGDGRADLFVTNLGPDALLVARGDGAFDERAAGTPLADPRFTSACGFGDLDRDGHLDLVVVAYVDWAPGVELPCVAEGIQDYCDVNKFDPLPDRVWRGDGRGGFEERTAQWGFGSSGPGLGLALLDLDDDGDVDAYVANDSMANALFLNRGDGRLEDASARSGAAVDVDGRTQAGMGVAAGDADGDGLPDLLVTNFAGESNTLYGNRGGGSFRDVSRTARITAASRTDLGFGVVFADLDRDGREDAVVGNGHVLRHVERLRPAWSFAQADVALRALPDGTFDPWELGEVLDVPRVTRGMACGDLDGDGAVDLVLSGHGEPLRVARNRIPAAGAGWLRVRLVDDRGTNSRAIGARVRLVLDDGAALSRWVRSGTGYLSQDDLAPSFGVPRGRAVERLEVRWPDGGETTIDAPALDRTLVVERGR